MPKKTAKKKPAPKPVKTSGVFSLFNKSCRHLLKNWKIYATILAVYGVLTLVLVHGIGNGTSLKSLKADLQSSTSTKSNQLSDGFSLFGSLLSSNGSSSDTSAVYQIFVLLIGSLAVIWMLRQTHLKKLPKGLKARDAYYNGIYPLVPFILVLLIIALQLVPLAIGGSVYSTVLGNGIAITGLEKALAGLFFLALSGLSLYLISGSVLALYIVTLPGMAPLRALRSSRQLVRGRRLAVLSKVIFLPIALLVIAGVIMLPVIIFLTAIGEALFFILSLMALAVTHSYMYELYRELIK